MEKRQSGRMERQLIPAEVWEAIRNALKASGRLAGMRADDYIFSSLAEPGKAETGSRAEDWKAERRLTSKQILYNLKLYGRLAGIEEEKLTLMALRRTAIRLRLDEGASLGEMQAFMDCREEAKSTKYRLGKLPQLPVDEMRTSEGGENEVRVLVQKGKPFKPGDGTTHGFYARSQPPESVAAVLKEGVQGIGEEIVGLRMLARGLLERQEQARNSQEAA